MNIRLVEQRLLNDFQRDFPLTPAPFAEIAKRLESDPQIILSTLKALHERGMVSRIGPVLRPHAIGSSTLAAMAVPANEIENIAAIISGFEAVNHNYEREHHFNLWFVVTAGDPAQLRLELENIEKATGYVLISLPLVVGHHIDLGFKMNLDHSIKTSSNIQNKISQQAPESLVRENTILDEQLIETIQFGLPLVERPYQVVGEKIARAGRLALQRSVPFIIVSQSGGARMQEGIYSLMQMAKTSTILARLHEASLPFISVLTNPTTGGTTASHSMLGDVNLAEPNALIGFTGPRVIEETIKQKLPKGFQRSEFQLEHGMIDLVVDRRDLKETIAVILRHQRAGWTE